MKEQVPLRLLVGSLLLLCVFTAHAQFVQQQMLLPAARQAKSEFGNAVALDGNVMAVGSHRENDNSGAVYVYEKTNGQWNQTARLTTPEPPSPKTTNNGYALALVGNTLVVSEADGVGASSVGMVHIYERGPGGWTHVKKLSPSDPATGSVFGQAVALSGNFIVVSDVGQRSDANGQNIVGNAGAVYIFEKGAGGWSQAVQTQKLVASDRAEGDYFGWSLDVQGTTLVVGAINQSTNASNADTRIRAGAAYVFEKGTGGWSQTQKLIASDRTAYDLFGHDVKLLDNTVFVGAPLQDTDASGANPISDGGAIYVFAKSGNSWSQSQKLVGSDRSYGLLGGSLSVSGNVLVTGARANEMDENGVNRVQASGAAYVFERGTSSWYQTQKLLASPRVFFDLFGISVAIQGNQVFVGAYGQPLDNSGAEAVRYAGAVYFFTRPEAPPSNGCAVTRLRILPRLDCCAGRLVGGQIQASIVGKNGPWQTIHQFNSESAFQWQEVNLPDAVYKAVRYVSPNGGYGNVAELEFYNGTTKLTGTVFDDGSGPWNDR